MTLDGTARTDHRRRPRHRRRAPPAACTSAAPTWRCRARARAAGGGRGRVRRRPLVRVRRHRPRRRSRPRSTAAVASSAGSTSSWPTRASPRSCRSSAATRRSSRRRSRSTSLGVYYTLRAAGPHISHPSGYALAIASLAAAVHAPLLGAYSASKAAVEALGNTLRIELAPDRRAGRRRLLRRARHRHDPPRLRAPRRRSGSAPRPGRSPAWRRWRSGINAIERGIERRSRRVVAPGWVAGGAADADGRPAGGRPRRAARPARDARGGPLRGAAADHAPARRLSQSAPDQAAAALGSGSATGWATTRSRPSRLAR